MFRILTIDWTESGRRLNGAGRRLNGAGMNKALIALLGNYIHALIKLIHFSSDNNGTIIFGLPARIFLRISKPFAFSSLYNTALFFLAAFAQTYLRKYFLHHVQK